MTFYLIPLAIVGGIVAMLVYARWRTKGENVKSEQRTDELIAAVVAVELKHFPKLADRFSQYVWECFGVNLSQMDFKKHIQYIGKNLQKLRKKNYLNFFPAGEGEFIAAAAANLGEVIGQRYNVQWRRDDQPPFFPFLSIELKDGKKTYCNPAGYIITQIISGDDTQAITRSLLQLENLEKVESYVTEVADNIYVDDEKTELKFSPKLPMLIKRILWGSGIIIFLCLLGPACFLIFDAVNRQNIGLQVMGIISASIFIGVMIYERWEIFELPKYRKLAMYQDHFCIVGDHDVINIAYQDVLQCKTGYAAAQYSTPEMFLKVKTAKNKISLNEKVFTCPHIARDIFLEIAKRIEQTKINLITQPLDKNTNHYR